MKDEDRIGEILRYVRATFVLILILFIFYIFDIFSTIVADILYKLS